MSKKKRVQNKNPTTLDSIPELPGILNNTADIVGVKKMMDAYTNPPANLGAGAMNLTQTAGYVMERFTWDYYTLNILFRNNWIAKAIIEKPANEMIKNGFEIQSEMEPSEVTKIMQTWTKTHTKDKFLKNLKWARLYGGSLLIPMISNQGDLSEPLDYDTILPDSYKGCFIVDRWSGCSPSLELVTDIEDPEFGEPKYYMVSDNTTGKTYNIHHSRVIKMIGRELPYWEQIAEQFWGASELEHVFTELKKRDDTSANISFLIFLANIRTIKSDNLGQMITLGDQQAANNVYETMRTMNRLMCNTGMLVMDKEDGFEEHQYSFTGINDVYESFMLDISGAAEIPVDKLFGRSASGFNSGAESLQNYYDTMQEKQETYVRNPLEKIMRIITMSAIGYIPDDMEIVFNPIRRPADLEKADLAMKQAQPIMDAYGASIIGKATTLRELKQQSSLTGLWSNITDEMIEEAKKEDAEKKEQEKQDQDELLSFMKNGGKDGINNAENSTENPAAAAIDKSLK